MKSIIVYTYMFLFMFFTSMLVTTISNIGNEKQSVNYLMDFEDSSENKKQKTSSSLDDFIQHSMLNLKLLKTRIVKVFSPFICLYDYFHFNTILQPPELVHFVN